MKLVSIIVPIYNGMEYIEILMESLSSQTYTDIEILLVDNASTDATAEVCKRYVESDNRVRYLYAAHPGVSYARNMGIRESKGTYILFVDVDDRVNSTYVESLVASVQHGATLGICRIKDEYVSLNQMRVRRIGTQRTGVFNEDYVLLQPLLRVPVAKIYEKDILLKHNIFFPEHIKASEDQIFNFSYYEHVSSYAWAENAEYVYVHRENTLSADVSERVYYDNLEKLQLERSFLINNGIRGWHNAIGISGSMMMKQFLFLAESDKNSIGHIKARLKEIYEVVKDIEVTDNRNRKLLMWCLKREWYGLVALLMWMKRYVESKYKR